METSGYFSRNSGNIGARAFTPNVIGTASRTNPRGAIEYFDYACDIDPKPVYRAWRAWARYLLNPDSHGRLALQELAEICRDETATDEPFRFAGEIHRKLGNYAEAETAFRKAFKLNPSHRAYADSIQQVLKAQKR